MASTLNPWERLLLGIAALVGGVSALIFTAIVCFVVAMGIDPRCSESVDLVAIPTLSVGAAVAAAGWTGVISMLLAAIRQRGVRRGLWIDAAIVAGALGLIVASAALALTDYSVAATPNECGLPAPNG